jgi:hypothetical protein
MVEIRAESVKALLAGDGDAIRTIVADGFDPRGRSSHRIILKRRGQGHNRQARPIHQTIKAAFVKARVDDLERAGWSREAAVHEVMRLYKISRATVYAALRKTQT